jgi:hypothetical protein
MSYPVMIGGPMTAADWAAQNPILDQFELGVERDAITGLYGKAKIGDGITAWNDLPYWSPSGAGAQAIFSNADDPLILTNAQIKNIPTRTPEIEIVAAQGAGKIISPVPGGMVWLSVKEKYIAGSVPDLRLGWTNSNYPASATIGADSFSQTPLTNDTGGVLSTYQIPISCPGLQSVSSGDLSGQSSTLHIPTATDDLANKALVLLDYDNNFGSPYTGGDALNSMKVTVLYTVIDVS